MVKPDVDSLDPFGFQGRRAAIERDNEERAANRLARLDELSSSTLSIAERVRLWESLHELRLPVDPRHALLRVIARATGLDLEQLHAEQQRRKGGPAVKPSSLV